MLRGTRILTIRGIPVHAHWSSAVIIALVGFNIGGVAGPLVGFLAGLLFLGSVLMHELAHAFTARRFGVPTERITLWGLGGIAALGAEAPTPKAEGWIAAAGPLMSAALGGIGIGGASLLHLLDIRGAAVGVLFWLGLTNAVLAAFNLLPGAPLDGGRIMVSLLPRPLAFKFAAIERYGFFILLALLFTGILGKILAPLISATVYVVAVFCGLPAGSFM